MIPSTGTYFVRNNNLFKLNRIDQCIEDKNDIIYEVIRIIDRKPLFLEDHLNRFLHTFHLNQEDLRKHRSSMIENIRLLIEKNNIAEGNIRFQFNNNDMQSFCTWMIPHTYPSTDQYRKGVRINSYYAERQEPRIKARDIKLRTGADQIIKEQEVFEVILINSDGQITEGSRSNIFFIKSNLFITPPISLVLPGITRQKIIQLLNKENDIRFEERPVQIAEISSFDSCFITGTSPKILPIAFVDKLSMQVEHPLLLKLIHLYDQQITAYLKNFRWE
jgi:branched-chain amino acid aminotransferase